MARARIWSTVPDGRPLPYSRENGTVTAELTELGSFESIVIDK
jgi:hypothetical protein